MTADKVTQQRAVRRLAVLLAGIVLLIAILLLAVVVGAVSIPLRDVWLALQRRGRRRLSDHLYPAHPSRTLCGLGRGQPGLIGLHPSRRPSQSPGRSRHHRHFGRGGPCGYGLMMLAPTPYGLVPMAAFFGRLGSGSHRLFPGLGTGRQSPAPGPGRRGRSRFLWRRHDGLVGLLFR